MFELACIVLFCFEFIYNTSTLYSYAVLSVFINSLSVLANSLINPNCELITMASAMRADLDDEMEDQFEMSLEDVSDPVAPVEPPPTMSHACSC